MSEMEDAQVEFLGAREEMAARFLRALAKREEGQIIVLNLEAGLRLGCIIEDNLREVIQECLNRLPPASEYDPAETLAAFVQATKVERFRFLRQPVPDLGVPVALALSTALLFDPKIGLVDQQALDLLEEAGLQRDLLAKQTKKSFWPSYGPDSSSRRMRWARLGSPSG
jgi:hypothetical protein